MKNWTIGKRITFGFASVLVLVTATAIISTISLRSIRRDLVKVTEDALPGVTAIGDIEALVNQAQGDVLRHMLATKPEDKKALEQDLAAKKESIDKALDAYEKTIHLDEDRQNFAKLQDTRQAYVKARAALLELSRAGKTQEMFEYDAATTRPAFEAYLKAADAIQEWNASYGRSGAAQITSTIRNADISVTTCSVIAIGLGIALSAIIGIGIKRALSHTAESLDTGAQQVASAAGQVSSSSQTLAEGASEQAASIEEASSSLEEMAAMTKRNAENSQKANDLAKQARVAADKGVGDMQAMSDAMNAIKSSSDDIAKIIKTIDEIAFQTNILALNAAVEAARAGEAGMGFAVVADEVRNLAQRSAEAAKETAAKIEGAIAKTGQGVQLSARVAETLNEIVTKSRQVDELAAEVASASQEQTQGISQLNAAVGQMDKVTQSNAANAEESASAAEELNGQAMSMKETVAELVRLVGGSNKNRNESAVRQPVRPAKVINQAPAVHTNGNGHHRRNGIGTQSTLTPAQRSEIPLEEAFKDF